MIKRLADLALTCIPFFKSYEYLFYTERQRLPKEMTFEVTARVVLGGGEFWWVSSHLPFWKSKKIEKMEKIVGTPN